MSITATVSYIIGVLLVALTTAFLTYKQDSEMLHDYRERLMELRSDHDKTLLEKAEIEKNCFTLEQINAGLLADNARLKAERDAALSQQEETENVEIAAEPAHSRQCPSSAVCTAKGEHKGDQEGGGSREN